MRAGFIKPKSLSVDAMPSNLKIINHYLTNFPTQENKSCSGGEMIEISLSILPVVWINSMITAGLEPREKSYEDLIEHLENI